MGKTHSKRLAARHGRGTVWARHAMCESALRVKYKLAINATLEIVWSVRCRIMQVAIGQVVKLKEVLNETLVTGLNHVT